MRGVQKKHADFYRDMVFLSVIVCEEKFVNDPHLMGEKKCRLNICVVTRTGLLAYR